MKTYIPELNSLVRSILIKSSHQATMINNYIIKTYGSSYVDEEKPETWKYYLNLNGEYHFSNNKIMCYIIELDSIVELTKEVLEVNKKTKASLMEFGDAYKELIGNYPNDELLIRGILFPTEYETASSMEDGSIISYSSTYLEQNEVSLIHSLSTYSISMYTRWFNDMYINTSLYYLPIFLTYLYSTFYIKIDSIRMENIHTHRVSKFHMKNFFSSNLDIDTQYMNDKSKFWLYQNLRAIMINAGKEETLDQIIDNVITPNGLGVGVLTLKKAKPAQIEANNNAYNLLNFDANSSTQLLVLPRNELYYSDGLTVSEVTNMEVESGYIHNSVYNTLSDLLDEVSTKLSKNNEITNRTKVLHILGKEARDILPFPRINLVLDTLFHIYTSTNTDYLLTYLDENTNNTYTITFKQAIRLLGHYLLKLADIDSSILRINSNAVVKRVYTDVKDNFIDDGSDYEYIDIIRSYAPTMYELYYNGDGIVDYIRECISYFTVDWLVKSLLENQVSYTNAMLMDKYNHNGSFEIIPNGVDTEIGLILNDNYDYLNSIKSIINSITSGQITMDLSEVNYASINSYIDLLKKTTSYNIQIIGSTISGNSLNVFDVNMDLIKAAPIITIKSKYVNGLEDLSTNLEEMDMSTVYVFNRAEGGVYLESELVPDVGYGFSTSIGRTTIPKPLTLSELTTIEDVMAVKYSESLSYGETQLNAGEGIAVTERTTPMLEGDVVRVDLGESTIYSGILLINDITSGEE